MKITRIVKATVEELGNGEVNIKIRNIKTQSMVDIQSAGGKARMASMTPEARSKLAKKAGEAPKKKKDKLTNT